MKSYKNLFSASLKNNPNHFAAHSHHPWPDVTLDAQKQAWVDATNGLDHKWANIFKNVLHPTRQFLANLLGGLNPDQICEGQNTFELLVRLMSSLNFDRNKKVKILSTDSEFYSFKRLAHSLALNNAVELVTVAAEPFDTFSDRLEEKLASESFELIYVSHVFFNSGFVATPVFDLIKEHKKSAMVIIDGYHSLGAIPVNINDYANDFYYLGGGYKYLSSGEGCCFVYAPPNDKRKPVITGWYTMLADVANATANDKISYPTNGQKWAGATFDPTAWYRFKSVCDLWNTEGINPLMIHDRVRSLQSTFLEELKRNQVLNKLKLVGYTDQKDWGNFLTFESSNAEIIEQKLKASSYTMDRRNQRLRFGFGIYHDTEDVIRLANQLSKTLI